MNQKDLYFKSSGISPLTKEEELLINGGDFMLTFLLVGAGAAAVVGIYELGKATGDFIYHVTH